MTPRTSVLRLGMAAALATVLPGHVHAGQAAPAAGLRPLRTASAVSGPFQPTVAPSLDGSPVEYLIVTGDALAPEFERLAAWKTAKGVPAVVRTMSQVRASALHGSDLQETVRN